MLKYNYVWIPIYLYPSIVLLELPIFYCTKFYVSKIIYIHFLKNLFLMNNNIFFNMYRT